MYLHTEENSVTSCASIPVPAALVSSTTQTQQENTDKYNTYCLTCNVPCVRHNAPV